MDAAYAERRRPSRDTPGNGYVEDDIGIPRRGGLQSTRRVQETQAFLASPGPLESMLKTTTETGDIGVFSIRPSRSSSRSHTPIHPMPAAGASVLARTMSMNAPERRFLQDDRRALVSHRDTTSEVISLYRSNGQRSMHGSYSRSPEDPGPRSYSLTSCSSRYMSDQKSTGTWDSRSSGGSAGVLARARSPYPYHTRLKRPGVRPSSPALTMDGVVDYSRTVEVDRPSYRTIHQSYNRSYPPNPPRRSHPRHRPFDFHLARSLPGDGDTFMLSRHGSVTPKSHSPWVNHASGQVGSSSSDQSAGVSSITSIVQMYGSSGIQPGVRQPPISRMGSFYYDYSEDFQEHSLPVACEQVTQMHGKVPSMSRPMMLGNNCELMVSAAMSTDDAAADPHHSDCPSSPARSYSGGGGCVPRLECEEGPEDAVLAGSVGTSVRAESVDWNNVEVPQDVASGNSDSESSLAVSEEGVASKADAAGLAECSIDTPQAPATAQLQKQEQSLVNIEENVAHDTRISSVCLVFDHSQTKDHPLGDAIDNRAPETPSATTGSAATFGSESTEGSSGIPHTPTLAARRRSNVYSLQPGLLDLKSFVQDLDDAGLLHDVDASGDSLDRSKISSCSAKLHDGTNVHAVLARGNEVPEAKIDRSSTCRDTRQPAVSKAISRLKTNVTSECRQFVDDSTSIILAPHPVSPARQLRLRSSVSKLMKALPPVPDRSADTAPKSVVISFDQRRLQELPVPPRVSLSGSGQSPSISQLEGFCRTDEYVQGASVDVLTSNACFSQIDDNDVGRDIYGDIWDTHFGRRDNSAATTIGMGSNSGFMAHATVPTADEIFRDCKGVTGPYIKQPHPLGREGYYKSSTMRSKPIVRESSAHLNSISQARGTSLDTGRTTSRKPEVPSKELMPPAIVKSDLADNDLRPHRGLKKRLSDIRIRLTESRHRAVEWSSSDVRLHEDGEIIGMAVPVTSSTGSPESSGARSGSNSGADETSARGLRYKISRWLKSAKHAVNGCKRLSNSTGGTSLETDF